MRYSFIAIFLKTKKPEATISLVEDHFSGVKPLPGIAHQNPLPVTVLRYYALK